MQNMLQKYGDVTTKEIDYVAFRGSRNLKNRNIHTTEYIFVLKKNKNRYYLGKKNSIFALDSKNINESAIYYLKKNSLKQ